MEIKAISSDDEAPGSINLVCEEKNRFNPNTDQVILPLDEIFTSHQYENVEIVTMGDPTNHR